MSRHHFETHIGGRPVVVVVGWDRPVGGYFCTVERRDAREDEDEFVYTNLDDEALMPNFGFAASVNHFESLFREYGLAIPSAMVAELERDAALNTGNRSVWYDPQGAIVPGAGLVPTACTVPAITEAADSDTASQAGRAAGDRMSINQHILATIYSVMALDKARRRPIVPPGQRAMSALGEAILAKDIEVQAMILAGEIDTTAYKVATSQVAEWSAAWHSNR